MGFYYERIFPENGERCERPERIGAVLPLRLEERETFLPGVLWCHFLSIYPVTVHEGPFEIEEC
jgi:hypothetical protein